MEEVQYHYPLPLPNVNKKPVNPFTGDFSFRDDFAKEPLSFRYIFLRTSNGKWYNTKDKAGWLGLQLRPQTVSGLENPSSVGFRQQHNHAFATTKLAFTPTGENEKAGLVIIQNETHFYYLCKSLMNGKPMVQLYQSSKDTMMLLASHPLSSNSNEVSLRIEPNGAVYSFSFSENGKNWTALKEVDGKFLSTETAGGFVGCVFGLYATSIGKQSNAKAYFDWFEYKGDDKVFK